MSNRMTRRRFLQSNAAMGLGAGLIGWQTRGSSGRHRLAAE